DLVTERLAGGVGDAGQAASVVIPERADGHPGARARARAGAVEHADPGHPDPGGAGRRVDGDAVAAAVLDAGRGAVPVAQDVDPIVVAVGERCQIPDLTV